MLAVVACARERVEVAHAAWVVDFEQRAAVARRVAAHRRDDRRLEVVVAHGHRRDLDGLFGGSCRQGGLREHDRADGGLHGIVRQVPNAVVGGHDDGRIVVDAELAHLVEVFRDHAHRAFRLRDLVGLVRADVVSLLVDGEGEVRPEQVDEPKRARAALVLDGEPLVAQHAEDGGVVELVERVVVVRAAAVGDHAVVDVARVIPEQRLCDPERLAVQGALLHGDERAPDVDWRAVDRMDVVRQLRRFEVGGIAEVHHHRVGIDAHRVVERGDVFEERALLVFRAPVLAEILARRRLQARQQVRDGVRRRNHGARAVGPVREVREVVEERGVLFADLLEQCGVVRVEHEDDDVVLGGHGQKVALRDVGLAAFGRLGFVRLDRHARNADELHDDDRAGEARRGLQADVAVLAGEDEGHDDDERPDDAREDHLVDEELVGPPDEAAVGRHHALVHEQRLHVGGERHQEHGEQRAIEGAAFQQRDEQSADERERRAEHDGNPPDGREAEHEAVGVGAHDLEGGGDEDDEEEEHGHDEREHETRPPGHVAHRVALGEAAAFLGKLFGLGARVGEALCGIGTRGVDALDGRVDDLVGVLVNLKDLVDLAPRAPERHAGDCRKRDRDARERLDRVGHDRRVDVGIRRFCGNERPDEREEECRYDVERRERCARVELRARLCARDIVNHVCANPLLYDRDPPIYLLTADSELYNRRRR